MVENGLLIFLAAQKPLDGSTLRFPNGALLHTRICLSRIDCILQFEPTNYEGENIGKKTKGDFSWSLVLVEMYYGMFAMWSSLKWRMRRNRGGESLVFYPFSLTSPKYQSQSHQWLPSPTTKISRWKILSANLYARPQKPRLFGLLLPPLNLLLSSDVFHKSLYKHLSGLSAKTIANLRRHPATT
jgi:hypothetical protein